MRILFFCILITLGFLGVLYIWGKSFLTAIHGTTRISDCILFGFVIIHILFQIIYLPFLLTRGSFYSLAVIWLIGAILITVGLLFYMAKKAGGKNNYLKNPNLQKLFRNLSIAQIICGILAIAVNIFLCLYIGCRPRPNGYDTIQYIQRMNEMVYRGYLWNNGNALEIHQGLNSFYSLFAVLSWMTGIKPLYISCFTMRFLGIIFTSMLSYRFGWIAFGKKNNTYPILVAIIVPLAMMIWKTDYATGRFFYERTNESKAFCQLFLFPLSVSLVFQMFLEENNRKLIWKEQIAVGLSAVPIAVSSLSIYPVIIFAGMVGLLVNDRFKGAIRTIYAAFLCVFPNLLYLGFYVLYQKQILRF